MADSLSADPSSGMERIRAWIAGSPFVGHLGMRLARLEPDLAEIALPYREVLATLGDVVHGGAICALIDSAATAAAWSGVETSGSSRGATVGLSVNFLNAGRGRDLVAKARVTRRGRSLCFCDVDVIDAGGKLVATGLVTYKLG